MTLEQVKKKIKNKKVILDFDGVITNIEIEWEKVRKDLKEYLGVNESLNMAGLYLYSQGNGKKREYLNRVAKYEIAGMNINLVSPLFETIVRLNMNFSIFSSNTKKSINHFLANYKLSKQTIIAADDVKFLKPNPEGLLRIMRKKDKNSFIFIGNSINDKLAASLAQVKYINYDF